MFPFEKSYTPQPMSASGAGEVIAFGPGIRNWALELIVSIPAAAAAFTANGATDAMTSAAHGWYTGMQAQVSTDDTLPGGLTAVTDYWLIRLTANTFKLAASLEDALAGDAIDLDDAGTGVHTLTPTAGTLDQAIQLEKSVDGENWHEVGSPTAISEAGAFLFEGANVAYKFLRFNNEVTTGQAVYKMVVSAN